MTFVQTTLLFICTYLAAVPLWRISAHIDDPTIRKVFRYSLVYMSLPFIYLSPKFSILTNVWMLIVGNLASEYRSSGSNAVVVAFLCIWGVIILVAMIRADKPIQNQEPIPAEKIALEQLAAKGVDLSLPTEIEFTIEAHDKITASTIEKNLMENQYESSVHFDEGELDQDGNTSTNAVYGPAWMIFVVIKMTPTLEEIKKIKTDLSRIAILNGGKYKGWLLVAEKGRKGHRVAS